MKHCRTIFAIPGLVILTLSNDAHLKNLGHTLVVVCSSQALRLHTAMRDHSLCQVVVSVTDTCTTSLHLAYLARPGVLDLFPAILVPLPCTSGASLVWYYVIGSSTPVNAAAGPNKKKAAHLRRVEAERINPSRTFRVRFKQVKKL